MSDMLTEDTRGLLDPALRDALERLDPTMRHLCGYHLGLWDADGAPGATTGKRIRPALALLSARAAGAGSQVGLPAAVACELVHNFSLLHDDVMDGDRERHHRPTVWARFGVPQAILAGDAMVSLANEVLAGAPSPTTAWAVGCLNATTRRLIAGQTADLAFESRTDVTLDECLQMADDKTGALIGCAASLGVVLADGPAELALELAEFGHHLGLAFQLVDDLLGIWGSPARTGKPVHSDLRARKKSLPVVAALNGTGADVERLRTRYFDPDPDDLTDPAALAELAALVESADGRRWAEQEAARQTNTAVKVLDRLDLPRSVHEGFVVLTNTLGRRNA
ncbi:MAG TPA: polyprenyl synthetase family protein [Nocardioidaceae bacterium]|nr:polyprenyl synthetase family protein [Nocardioidaceae bacterium]